MLRSHQLLPDGSRRDTVVYSILDIEWPAVRNNLRFRLDRPAARPDDAALPGARPWSGSIDFWLPLWLISILRGFALSATGIVTVSTPFS